MDNRRKLFGYDADQSGASTKPPGDAPIYIFTLFATILIVTGLFVWLSVDPVLTPTVPQTAVLPEFAD